MAGTCFTFTIRNEDILQASGNTLNPTVDGVVYAEYLDSGGNYVVTGYTVAGVYTACVQAFNFFRIQQDNLCYTSTGGGVGCSYKDLLSAANNLGTSCTNDSQCVCDCYNIDVTITQGDLDAASGNTSNPNGTVFYQYNTCVNPNPQVSESYTVAGTYPNSVCALGTQIAYSLFYYYQNDVLKDSQMDVLTSSYSVSGCCVTPTPTPTITSTPTVTPTEPYDVYLFLDCNDTTNYFRYQNVPGSLIVGDVYQITGGVGFNGIAKVQPYSAVGTIYNGGGVTFVGGSTLCPTPTQTKTPTPTPSPTVTPSASVGLTPTATATPSQTPTYGTCNSSYCLRTTLPSISGYSGNYTPSGTYNSYDYYEGDGTSFGVIYYTGDKWCLSSSLGGACLLEGSYPCYSPCPDISANHFVGGVCPTPTPTPVNCSTFDFNAYFDCDWEPIPTPTPSVACDDVNFIFDSLLTTPTPTATNPSCEGGNISFIVCEFNEPTPSVTLTPTVTLTKTVDVQGQVTFQMLDEVFACVSVKVLVNCLTGEELYTSDNLVFSGIPVTIGITLLATINGEDMCVTYVRDDSTISSNSNVTEIYQIYSKCGDCSTLVTPTPTQTATPTNTPTVTTTQTNTPTTTQTPTNSATPNVTPTPTNTPTPSVTIGLTPTMTPSNTASPTKTPTVTPTNTATSTPTPSITATQTPTNTMTPTPSVTPNYVYVYESCSPISPNVLPTQVIQTVQVPFVTVIGNTFKDINANCWKFVGQYPSVYIAPPTVIPITFVGDYFATAYSTVYVDCVDCINTPLCFDYLFENIATGFGVLDIRPNQPNPCPTYVDNNLPVPSGDNRCIHSSVPLNFGLPNAKWADNHLPDPVFGVDYIITLNACP